MTLRTPPSRRRKSVPGPSRTAPPPFHAGEDPLTLLIDADDTLWENNIFFLEVTEEFLSALHLHGVDRDLARAALTETESRNIIRHGYGSRSFALSVAEAFRALAPTEDAAAIDRLSTLARGIFERDRMILLPGVADALSALSRRHRLILVTKGDREEQERKVERSGLREHFEIVEVVPEKDVETYRGLIQRLGLDASRTWMIGNSPRSDINPAVAAGLHAVLIPHPQTWELELEEIEGPPDRVTVVESLSDVVRLFTGEQEE
jgi:putative hydrolase of the HAD superfamily